MEEGVDYRIIPDSVSLRGELAITRLTKPEDVIAFTPELVLTVLAATRRSVPGWDPLPSLQDLDNPRACARDDCVTPVEIMRAMLIPFNSILRANASLVGWASNRNIRLLESLVKHANLGVQKAMKATDQLPLECMTQILDAAKVLQQHATAISDMVQAQSQFLEKGGIRLVLPALKQAYTTVFRAPATGGWVHGEDSVRLNAADSPFIRFSVKFCEECGYSISPLTVQHALYTWKDTAC